MNPSSMSFLALPKQTEWFIRNASALNRLALVKLKTNGLLTTKLLVLIPLTEKWNTNSPLVAQKYRN